MVKSAEVPPPFEAAFSKAESCVESLFSDFQRHPEEGTIRVGGERYVLVRAKSLYLAWFDAMESSFGAEAASDFIYNTAREIGGGDARELAKRLNLDHGLDTLAAGPIHFAFVGWARVELLADCNPALDDKYFLHYYHPNTFESEGLRQQGRRSERPACLFSAGYSAGWCSVAFGFEVHAREIRCLARGEPHCEFIMAPAHRLDGHEREVAARWTAT